MKFHKILSLLLALAMLTALFTGCTGQDDPNGNSGNSTPSTQTPSSDAVGEKPDDVPGETTGSSDTEATDPTETTEATDPTETIGAELKGTILEDTYVAAFSADSKDKNYADYETIVTNKNSARPLFKFDISNILNSDTFAENKDTAKIQFTFAIIEGGENLVSDTKCNAYGFLPGKGVGDADFGVLTWNTCSSDGSHNQLYRNGATYLYKDGLLVDVDIEVTSKYITYTFSYSEIAQFVCTEAGDTYGYLVMGFDFSNASGVKFASMENSSFDAPAVSFVWDE